MKTITRTETDIQNLQFGFWDVAAEEFVPIAAINVSEIKQAAVALNCSELLVDALVIFASSISQMVGDDLRDIWQRLDRIEG